MIKHFAKEPSYSLVMMIALFFWALLSAGCKKDTAAIVVSATAVSKTNKVDSNAAVGLINNPAADTNTIIKVLRPATGVLTDKAQTNNPVAFFDAELTKRGDLSAYAKADGNPYTAMVIDPSRISVVSDPVYGAKRKVMFMDVRTGDTGGLTENPRAQVQTPMNYREGQTVYVGLSVRFTQTFWTYFLTFSEFYGAPYAGSSPFRLGIQGSNLIAAATNNGKQNNLWQEPLQADQWYDFVYCEVLSADPSKGSIQLWLRKQGESTFRVLVPLTKMPTITPANIVGPNYHKLACYYDKLNTFTDATRAWRVDRIKMYLGNHKVAATFDAVAPALMR